MGDWNQNGNLETSKRNFSGSGRKRVGEWGWGGVTGGRLSGGRGGDIGAGGGGGGGHHDRAVGWKRDKCIEKWGE